MTVTVITRNRATEKNRLCKRETNIVQHTTNAASVYRIRDAKRLFRYFFGHLNSSFRAFSHLNLSFIERNFFVDFVFGNLCNFISIFFTLFTLLISQALLFTN